MAHEDGQLYWHDPDPRAVFPLERLLPNARLQTFIRSSGYKNTFDERFEAVMRGCAERQSTWIIEEMVQVYVELHRLGFAHSVETWKEGELIGGIYGLSIGGAFFGESMFSRETNASKAAFYHLSAHLRQRDFTLFDSQYINDHTRVLGAKEIGREKFALLLSHALAANTHF